MPKTVQDLVDAIYAGAVEQGMDLSPKDVGWIISTFVEQMFTGPEFPAEFNAMSQRIADECAAIRDE